MSISKGENVVDDEARFVKLVGSRYPLLRSLYPNKTYSFTKLSEISGIDTGNLSGYIKDLDENGVILLQKKLVNGRTRSLISLEHDTVMLIERVIDLKGKSQIPLLQDIRYLDDILENLFNEKIRDLTVNHIQRISKNYKIPVNSKFFDVIGKVENIEPLKPVISILLKALKNMVFTSNEEERKIIQEKVLNSLETMIEIIPKERPGMEAQRILNAFNWGQRPYQHLVNRYLFLFDKSEEDFKEVLPLRVQILDRYPEQKMDLRDRLIKLAKGADDRAVKRIENEFTLFL